MIDIASAFMHLHRLGRSIKNSRLQQLTGGMVHPFRHAFVAATEIMITRVGHCTTCGNLATWVAHFQAVAFIALVAGASMLARTRVGACGLSMTIRLMDCEFIAGVFGPANTSLASFTKPILLALASAKPLPQVDALGIGIAVMHRVTWINQIACYSVSSIMQIAGALGLSGQSRSAGCVGRAISAILLWTTSIDCCAELSLASVAFVAAATPFAWIA